MKKWLVYASLGLNVVLVALLIITWPPDNLEPIDLSKYTQQDLGKAAEIEPGMSKDAVLKVMGTPIARYFDHTQEEWHYCRTGSEIDEYIAAWIQPRSATVSVS